MAKIFVIPLLALSLLGLACSSGAPMKMDVAEFESSAEGLSFHGESGGNHFEGATTVLRIGDETVADPQRLKCNNCFCDAFGCTCETCEVVPDKK
jgi:hypothetical protein